MIADLYIKQHQLIQTFVAVIDSYRTQQQNHSTHQTEIDA